MGGPSYAEANQYTKAYHLDSHPFRSTSIKVRWKILLIKRVERFIYYTTRNQLNPFFEIIFSEISNGSIFHRRYNRIYNQSEYEIYHLEKSGRKIYKVCASKKTNAPEALMVVSIIQGESQCQCHSSQVSKAFTISHYYTMMHFGHFHSSLLFEVKFPYFCVDLNYLCKI